jgi:hypothetical protein
MTPRAPQVLRRAAGTEHGREGVGAAASASANLACLRGNFCTTPYSNDPAARATFGRPRGLDNLVYRRENF